MPDPHIIRYALPGEALTETIAAYLEAAAKDPFGTWFILPTKSLASDLLQTIASSGNHLLLPDHITTARDLAQYICRETDPDLHILSTGEQILLLRRILLGPALRNGTGSLFGRMPVTYTNCGSLQTLITALEQNQTSLSVIQPQTPKLSALALIHQEYTATLRKNRLADKETAYGAAETYLSSEKLPFRTVFLYGIYTPQPNEQAFLQSLIAASGTVHEVRPAADNPHLFPTFAGDIVSGDPDKAGFAAGLFAGHEHRIPEDLSISLTTATYPDTVAELSAVLDQICGLLEGGVSAKDILILSPDIESTASLIDDIIDDFSIQNQDGTRTKISYTAATARKLSDYPEITSLLAILKAPSADYPLTDLLQMLTLPQLRRRFDIRTSRLLTAAQTLGITRGKTNWTTIADQRVPFLRRKLTAEKEGSPAGRVYQKQIDDLLKLQNDLTNLIETISPKSQNKQFVLRHCTEYLSLLTDLGLLEPVIGENAQEQQLRKNAFRSLLTDLAASPLAKSLRLTSAEFSDSFAALCSNTPAPLPSRTGRYTITLAGLRESAHTTADHIFLLGLTQKNIPRILSTLPYLTAKETAAVRRYPLETELVREKYYFTAACLAANKTLHLSSAERDASGPLTPSSFLSRFPEQYKQEPASLSHSQTNSQKTAGSAILNGEHLCDHSDLFSLPPLSSVASRAESNDSVSFCDQPDLAGQFAEAYNDQTTFAPTTLETYASCPFKWYLEKHLRLTPPPSPDSEEYTVLGTVLHRIMERFFSVWTGPVTDENEQDAKDLLLHIASEEFARPGFTSPQWETDKNLYLTRRLPGVIEQEKTIRTAAFRRLEQPLADTAAVPLSDASPLRISGRPDRIDFFPDSSFTVYDYKSGDISKMKYKEGGLKEGISLQLPLYVAAVEAEDPGRSGSAAFYQIHPRGVKLQTFSKDALHTYLPDILSCCKAYRSGMQNGVCSPNPNSSDCSYCPWRFVCRVPTGGEE